jgi:hypothetical protein
MQVQVFLLFKITGYAHHTKDEGACGLNLTKVCCYFFQLDKPEEDNKNCRPGEPEFMKIHAKLRARMDSK